MLRFSFNYSFLLSRLHISPNPPGLRLYMAICIPFPEQGTVINHSLEISIVFEPDCAKYSSILYNIASLQMEIRGTRYESKTIIRILCSPMQAMPYTS